MEKVTSMTEEEFSKAAREVGWDDEWIQHLIEEARIDADMEQAQQRGMGAYCKSGRCAGKMRFLS